VSIISARSVAHDAGDWIGTEVEGASADGRSSRWSDPLRGSQSAVLDGPLKKSVLRVADGGFSEDFDAGARPFGPFSSG